MSIKKKIIKNTMIAGIAKVCTIIVSFFYIPIMIKNLGLLEFGLLAYLQIFTILGFLSIANLGLGPAIIKYVSELTFTDNFNEIYKLIITAFMTLLSIGIIVSLIGLYISDSIVSSLNVPDDQLLQFKEGFKFIFITIIFILPFSVFGNVLEGLQKYNIFKSLEAFFWIGYMIGAMYLSYSQVSFDKIFILFLYLQVLQHFLFFIFVQFHYKKNIFIISQFSYGWLVKMFQMGKYFTLMAIIGGISKSLEKLIIGIYLSPLFISYYEVIFKIPNTLKNMFSWLDTTIIPATSELVSKQRKTSIKKMFEKTINIKIVLLYPLIIMVFFFANDIIRIWISEEYLFLTKYLKLLLIWNIMVPIANHGSKFLMGLNQSITQMTKYSIVTNFLKIFLIFILIEEFSLLAIVIGYISIIITSPYIFNIVCKTIGLKKRLIYRSAIIVSSVSFGIIFTFYLMHNSIFFSEIALLFILVIILFFIYSVLFKLIFHVDIRKPKSIFSDLTASYTSPL